MTSQRPTILLFATWLLASCTPIHKPIAETQPAGNSFVATAEEQPAEKRYPLIIAAIIHVESKGNPRAVSRRGAKGLMQLMPYICRKFGVKRPFDPEENVAAGSKLFDEELERYNGNTELAVAAYNAGSPKVNRAIRLAHSTQYHRIRRYLPRETIKYVPRVFQVFNQLQAQGLYAFNMSQWGMLGEIAI